MRRDCEFTTEDGTVLRGFLHSPAESPAPGIVMAHGFSRVKEQIDHYAACFAEAGFSVLVYDHRGFGASGRRAARRGWKWIRRGSLPTGATR